MRPFAYLLIVASIIAGSLAATTAYAPRLSSVVDSAEPLTLAAPAGRHPAEPEKPAVAPGDARTPTLLTPDIVEQLRAANVARVRVKEFSIGRWDEAWLFGLAVLGLAAGGLLIRRDTRREIAVRTVARIREGASSPDATLDALHADVQALLRDVAGAPEDRQAAEILRRVEAIQATRLAPFVEARPELMGRYGVAAFARLMDPFAAAERQINRAWSAAADRALPESVASLERALALLDTTRARFSEIASARH